MLVVAEGFSSELMLVPKKLSPNLDHVILMLSHTSSIFFPLPSRISAQHTFTCQTEGLGGASHFTLRSTPACRLISVGHLLLDTHKRPLLVVAGSHPTEHHSASSFEKLAAPSNKVSSLLLSLRLREILRLATPGYQR